jgi:mannose-6-phosphate isomerase-like protein (cupin superfamily)
MDAYELGELLAAREASGELYHEFVRVEALSCGLYVLPAGGEDPQSPHAQDEVYLVMAGAGQIRVGEEDRPVQAGSVVYVPAHVRHRFHSIEDELRILVLFAPAETS